MNQGYQTRELYPGIAARPMGHLADTPLVHATGPILLAMSLVPMMLTCTGEALSSPASSAGTSLSRGPTEVGAHLQLVTQEVTSHINNRPWPALHALMTFV